MDQTTLSKILESHARWLQNPSNGERAYLSRANLSNAYLSGVYLSGANLSGADLSDADLSRADLSDADLSGAYLSGANLSGANLSGANLRNADLSDADLHGADLRNAYLRGAYLRNADLSGADLSYADLSGANLSGANLHGANLSGVVGLAIVEDAKERLKAVAVAALADDDALDMTDWHTCETTHCIAGWAIHQAGELGETLERDLGPANAGLMLLGVEAHSHFFDGNDKARDWLQSVIAE